MHIHTIWSEWAFSVMRLWIPVSMYQQAFKSKPKLETIAGDSKYCSKVRNINGSRSQSCKWNCFIKRSPPSLSFTHCSQTASFPSLLLGFIIHEWKVQSPAPSPKHTHSLSLFFSGINYSSYRVGGGISTRAQGWKPQVLWNKQTSCLVQEHLKKTQHLQYHVNRPPNSEDMILVVSLIIEFCFWVRFFFEINHIIHLLSDR